MADLAGGAAEPAARNGPVAEIDPPGILGRMSLPLTPPRLFALARDVTDAGGSLWTTGHGGSMSPVLRDGDRLLLTGSRTDLKVGSVVLGRFRGRLVVHRVVALADRCVRTRGDSCDVTDPWISRDDVAARVVAAERHGKLRCVEPTLRFGWLALARYAAGWAQHCARRALTVAGYRRSARAARR